MQKPMLDKQEMMRFLGDVIEAEMDKPEDEIDMELIAECDAYLAELLADIEISDEQMTANIAKIKEKACHTKAPETRPRRMPRPRRLVAAILAAALLIGGTLTAYAFVPAFRDMIRSVLKLGCGETIDENGITYVYNGERKKYNSIEDWVVSENLDILYPHELPDGLTVKNIFVAGEGETLTYNISFTDGISGIAIMHKAEDVSALHKESEIFVTPQGVISYVLIRESIIVSTTVHNDWTYYITTNTMDDLKIILDNLY